MAGILGCLCARPVAASFSWSASGSSGGTTFLFSSPAAARADKRHMFGAAEPASKRVCEATTFASLWAAVTSAGNADPSTHADLSQHELDLRRHLQANALEMFGVEVAATDDSAAQGSPTATASNWTLAAISARLVKRRRQRRRQAEYGNGASSSCSGGGRDPPSNKSSSNNSVAWVVDSVA